MRPPAQTTIAPAERFRLLPMRLILQDGVERVKKTISGTYEPATREHDVGVLVLDPRSSIIGADAAVARLLGQPPRALIGRSVETVLPEMSGFRNRVQRSGDAVTLHSFLTGLDIVATSMGEAGWLLTLQAPRPSAAPDTAAREKAAGRVAHKIRNSIATVLLMSNLLRSDIERLPPSDLVKEIEANLSRCESEAEALDHLVQGLKAICFASDEERLESIDVRELLRQVAALFDGELRVDARAETVMARPYSLRMALAILVQHAAELAPPGRPIELSVRTGERAVLFEVGLLSDLPEDALRGLELVRDVALKHGGELDGRRVSGGSVYRLTLPSEGMSRAES